MELAIWAVHEELFVQACDSSELTEGEKKEQLDELPPPKAVMKSIAPMDGRQTVSLHTYGYHRSDHKHVHG